MRRCLCFLFCMGVTLIAGCASSGLQTVGYPLQLAQAEETAIKAVLEEEQARLGTERMIELTQDRGGKYTALKIQEGVAIVKTTPQGHRAIKKVLADVRAGQIQ